MPKRVDHARRRAHIADALVRVAARDGLHAVTMRAVAAEAGTSLNLVQYYFETKAQLMHASLERLEQQSQERWSARLEALGDSVSARARLEAFVDEALPADVESRVFQQVWTAYAVLAMTDSQLAAQPFADGPDRLEQQLASILAAAQEEGEIAAHLDVAEEAACLLSLSHGAGTSVLVGQRSAAQARDMMQYHLSRLFGEDPGPAGAGKRRGASAS